MDFELNPILAYAQTADTSSMEILLICAGAVAVVLILALIPIGMARSRRHRFLDGIMAASLLWGILAAASLAYPAVARIRWENEQTLRLETGYGDPDDLSQRPSTPWGIWVAMGAAYVALLIWARSQKLEMAQRWEEESNDAGRT